jgi:hypothetical protein
MQVLKNATLVGILVILAIATVGCGSSEEAAIGTSPNAGKEGNGAARVQSTNQAASAAQTELPSGG